MFQWVYKLFGSAPRPSHAVRRVIKAKYDAAQTTDDNSRHWANADALSAREANSLPIRKKLRERCRYEVANNSYAKGIVLTIANQLVGPGPRLQVTTPDASLNEAVERVYGQWARAIRQADKLRTMKMAKTTDGELFGVFTTNPALPTSVKLDLRLVECDQITDGDFASYADPLVNDGIRYDESGNPVSYDVLRNHPGDGYSTFGAFDVLPARRVLHWFRADRPGQLRGIPELTPALPLFAQLRRFTLATLTAAETAAMFAALLETAAAPDGTTDDPTPFETLEIERGMMTTLPSGAKMAQLKAEHPSTTYEMFVRRILAEIARCLNVPYHIAAGDYGDSNYATARLGSQDFRLAIKVEREDCEREVLDPMLMAWLEEAVMIPGLLPASVGAFLAVLPHVWHWPAWDYIDPQTEASADEVRLRSGTVSLAEVCASRGQDWQQVIRQRAAERAFEARIAAELGAPAPTPQPQAVAAHRDSTPMIRAAGEPANLVIEAAQAIEIHAAASDNPQAVPRFEMLAYTGGAMRLDGFNAPVVVDLAGMVIPDQQRPILRDHKSWKIIGHTEIVTIEGSSLRAAGVISGTGVDAKEVRANAKNGFKWRSSIGASADALQYIDRGQTAEANGRTFEGPVYIARRSTLQEISFVPIGADGNATASVAASYGAKQMSFEQWCLGFMKLEEFQALSDDAKAALEMVFKKQSGGNGDTPSSDSATVPAAAATPPAPAAAAAGAVVNIQANAGVDIVAQMRQHAANEMARIDAIRTACASDPTLETEVNGRRVNIQQHAIAAGWTVDQTSLAVLRAERAKSTPFGYAVSAAPQVTSQVIEAAMCRQLGLKNIDRQFTPQVLEAADRHFRTIGLQQVLLVAAAQGGYHAGPGARVTTANLRSILRAAFNPEIRAGWTPLSVPGILGNVANKEILEGYMEEDQSMWEIAAVKSVSDFKSVTSYRLLDSMEYEQVGAGGEIKHGKLDEESYTRQAATYAKMLAITRQDIINDDLGAFDDIRARLGRGAAQKLNNVFWTEFLSNAATFWTTARLNYITGATTTLLADGVGLGLGVKAFRQMKSPSADGNKRIGGRPEILLVPPELEQAADQLYGQQNLATTAATLGPGNIYLNKYRPVCSPWLSDSNFTGYSTTAWYLLRDPKIAAAVVVSFLNGQRTPTIEDAEADFNVLGVQFRGYHDFGCDQAEYLCGVKSKGAA